jgi:hypothetical protein
MQQTSFDRWLKECFIYETHIFTLRLPDDKLPRGVKVKPVEQGKSGDYRYRLIVKSNSVADRLLEQLKASHIMYATHVVEGRHVYNRFLAPKGKSFTFQWIFRFLGLFCALSLVWFIYRMSLDGELMNTLDETIQDLKGSK